MLDRDFDAQLLTRVLALRRFALFDGVPVAELASVALHTREIELSAGASLGTEPSVDFIIDGSVATDGALATMHGLADVLSGRTARPDGRSITATRILRIRGSQLRELLEESSVLLRAVLRALANHAPTVVPSETGIVTSLDLVGRLRLLRRQPGFDRAPLCALTRLAHLAREVTWPEGAVVSSDSRSATAYLVAQGRLRSADGTTLGPGTSFGIVDALATHDTARTCEAVAPSSGLALDASAIFDVIEDHAELGFALIETLASRLVAHQSSHRR